MLVDHIGGLINHHRRGPDEWTVSSELSPDALTQIAAAPDVPVVGSAAVNDRRDEQPLNTASLRVNFLCQFRTSPESRYVGTALRVGRGSAVAEARRSAMTARWRSSHASPPTSDNIRYMPEARRAAIRGRR